MRSQDAANGHGSTVSHNEHRMQRRQTLLVVGRPRHRLAGPRSGAACAKNRPVRSRAVRDITTARAGAEQRRVQMTAARMRRISTVVPVGVPAGERRAHQSAGHRSASVAPSSGFTYHFDAAPARSSVDAELPDLAERAETIAGARLRSAIYQFYSYDG